MGTLTGIKPRLHLAGGGAELGRWAVIAVSVAAAAVISVGLVVARAAHSDLLNARMTIHEAVVADLIAADLVPLDPSDPQAVANLDAAVRFRLLGGETVRVKLWSPEGEILYSDATELIGQRFQVDPEADDALTGRSSIVVDELDGPENASERGFARPLLEFYMPVVVEGEVVAAFEIYELSTSFASSLSEIRADVWTAVGVGLAALLIAFGSLVVRYAHSLLKRRAEAEALAAQVLTAADEERRRIVSALHDDIGQPLYRIQYGLEGCLPQLGQSPVSDELRRLVALVAQIDTSLRSELRVLHSGLVEGDDLQDALRRLGRATRDEGKLEVRVTGDQVTGVSGVVATALFRATQEAVINARKHAQASLITINLTGSPGYAKVTIEDNGRGWNGRTGIGLATTRQWVTALDGTMRIERTGSRGTRVAISVPASGEVLV